MKTKYFQEVSYASCELKVDIWTATELMMVHVLDVGTRTRI